MVMLKSSRPPAAASTADSGTCKPENTIVACPVTGSTPSVRLVKGAACALRLGQSTIASLPLRADTIFSPVRRRAGRTGHLYCGQLVGIGVPKARLVNGTSEVEV